MATLEDLLVYNDVAYYGTPYEKNLVQFMMFDRDGNQSISFEEFEKFWKEYIYVYAEITREPLKYT